MAKYVWVYVAYCWANFIFFQILSIFLEYIICSNFVKSAMISWWRVKQNTVHQWLNARSNVLPEIQKNVTVTKRLSLYTRTKPDVGFGKVQETISVAWWHWSAIVDRTNKYIPVKVTLDISVSPIGAHGNIQGNLTTLQISSSHFDEGWDSMLVKTYDAYIYTIYTVHSLDDKHVIWNPV